MHSLSYKCMRCCAFTASHSACLDLSPHHPTGSQTCLLLFCVRKCTLKWLLALWHGRIHWEVSFFPVRWNFFIRNSDVTDTTTQVTGHPISSVSLASSVTGNFWKTVAYKGQILITSLLSNRHCNSKCNAVGCLQQFIMEVKRNGGCMRSLFAVASREWIIQL